MHRIREFQRFGFIEFIPATACVYFIPSCFFSSVRCTAHCHQQRVCANLANRASHISFNRLFRGSCTLRSRLQGQATNDCWMDLFECVIVIVIVFSGGRRAGSSHREKTTKHKKVAHWALRLCPSACATDEHSALSHTRGNSTRRTWLPWDEVKNDENTGQVRVSWMTRFKTWANESSRLFTPPEDREPLCTCGSRV